jgi:hypothetical protein
MNKRARLDSRYTHAIPAHKFVDYVSPLSPRNKYGKRTRGRSWKWPKYCTLVGRSVANLTQTLGGPSILQSAQNQTSQGESGIADSSDPLFSMYNKMAEEEDKKMAKSWKADADGILVFVSPNIIHVYRFFT